MTSGKADSAPRSSLREAVLERLDHLDLLATEGDERSRTSLATTEITRMTTAWRALLEQHEPDAGGRCPRCLSRWWLRRRTRPCSVWTTAHEHLVGENVRSSRSPHALTADQTSVATLAAP
ncbi:hypothetical protein LX15_003471 [Streptoalloteichus tenebrarius]|uniref:Uncharacterized protein n=1 Tax=Streptoalloteichus tenebrarius (strain ATCC 17920 / DSM 40477 / JCM 4838 / CBS 697.72 / NBRC 16177 / NCIMB 11028 / NRRL B-12390 / A12253. 1 / ISP 5477) TaxID=1933 RepID=A0ABT1HW96_STRSD|nr:hypothetical protein [Streptoalloteichus tenebrarius]BFE99292.1 hypothetical protein GCM10020241_09680 [Streptoalloteichus tenebrarius]